MVQLTLNQYTPIVFTNRNCCMWDSQLSLHLALVLLSGISNIHPNYPLVFGKRRGIHALSRLSWVQQKCLSNTNQSHYSLWFLLLQLQSLQMTIPPFQFLSFCSQFFENVFSNIILTKGEQLFVKRAETFLSSAKIQTQQQSTKHIFLCSSRSWIQRHP